MSDFSERMKAAKALKRAEREKRERRAADKSASAARANCPGNRHAWSVTRKTETKRSGRAVYFVRDATCRKCGVEVKGQSWSETLRPALEV